MAAPFLPFALAAAAALGFALWYWSDTRKLRRALRQAPRATVGSAVEGQLVRLDGRVAEGECLTAPLTGRRCVFYLVTVEERVSSNKASHWRTVIREQRGVPFALDDGTGYAIVDPSGARVDVDLDRSSQSGTFDDATPVEEGFLSRHGLRSTGWWLNRTLRYREGAIEIGEPVAVMGLPVREPDPTSSARAAGYRSSLPTRLRLGGSAKHPIVLSDARDVTSTS